MGQRTSEIAVRMALGARERQIVGKFVGEGMRLGIIGLAIGLPLGLIGLRIVSQTFRGPPIPITPIAVTAGIGVMVVALTATWLPLRRAAGVESGGGVAAGLRAMVRMRPTALHRRPGRPPRGGE